MATETKIAYIPSAGNQNPVSAVAGIVTIPSTNLETIQMPVNFAGGRIVAVTAVCPIDSTVNGNTYSASGLTVQIQNGLDDFFVNLGALNLMQECSIPIFPYDSGAGGRTEVETYIFGRGEAVDKTLSGSFPVRVHYIIEKA